MLGQENIGFSESVGVQGRRVRDHPETSKP